jgi:hypothetical protein
LPPANAVLPARQDTAEPAPAELAQLAVFIGTRMCFRKVSTLRASGEDDGTANRTPSAWMISLASSSCPRANRVLRLGYSNRAQMGHSCRAPRGPCLAFSLLLDFLGPVLTSFPVFRPRAAVGIISSVRDANCRSAQAWMDSAISGTGSINPSMPRAKATAASRMDNSLTGVYVHLVQLTGVKRRSTNKSAFGMFEYVGMLHILYVPVPKF